MKSPALISSGVDAMLWVSAAIWLLGWNLLLAFTDVAFGRGGKALRDMEGEA